jgi:hypothetical protein
MPYHISPNDGKFDVVDDSGKTIATHPTRQQAIDNLKALYANVSDASKEAHDKSAGGYVATANFSPIGANARELFFASSKDHKPSLIDRVVSFLKEGRRNSTNDASNLQQIHDLSVLNGADCPMVFKEASGRLRWVMLSSNSYQDTDKEIIAQAALEADVERADKEHNYGPLRWWHVGNPDPIARTPGDGIDIGDCDFNAMHGRMLIESGTFRDERIGGAIKEHADTLAGSIGFFHPLNQPDSGGVFDNIHRFERSLLPRARASNQLTGLTVTKEQQDMASMKEKYDQFVALLGGNATLADSVVKQAEATQKAAQEAGLAFKAKNDKPKDVKKGEEGSAEEEATEPETEAEAEGDAPKKFEKKMTAKKEAEIDYTAMAAGLAPHITALIDARMAESRKETATKEAGLTSQITTLETKLKEVEAVAKMLAGDLPRGVKDGYRASQSSTTVTTKDATNQPAPDPLGDFYGWVTESLGHQPQAAQPVQPPSA